MRTFTQSALTISLAAALLGGCGGSQPPIGPPGTMPQAPALEGRTNSTNYKVVYSFSGSPDGKNPVASLIEIKGTLYGTTENGGSQTTCRFYPYLCGTVFSITPSGKEKVLHTFGADGDGRNPYAGLIEMVGTLYGTTNAGGSPVSCGYSSDYFPCGTAFSITPSGAEEVMHDFGGTNGQGPAASLIEVKGMLYGTTESGGTHNKICNGGCGTVFSITPAGVQQVLHSFGAGSDGKYPVASLIAAKGKLYGTTNSGGAYSYSGTVFSITLGGREKVLHSFGYGADGALPAASLIEVTGTLYGTTAGGGAYGGGTVFSVTLAGKENVLHSFGNGTDGGNPNAGLLDVGGTLYGTTAGGGAYAGGTVFSITPSGAEEVLHSFGSGSDGKNPYASLIDVKGTLYGTTITGGAHSGSACNHGCGTVFALTP